MDANFYTSLIVITVVAIVGFAAIGLRKFKQDCANERRSPMAVRNK